jgi:hypothetical protein
LQDFIAENPFKKTVAHPNRDAEADIRPFGRVSRCQLRRLRDAPVGRRRSTDFNTSADEKINADNPQRCF